MKGMHACLLALAGSASGLALPVAAQQPTFDCAKAQGAVEKLICGDAALAALDRQLGEVYKSASAQAKGPLATRLREEQRGWVKGRNDCWKADGQKTWITATWTVDTVKGCVDAQYRLRISQLQAVWRLLPPKMVSYACQNNPANELVANFFATDPPTIRAERGDRSFTLWRVGAAADGHYEGQNVDLLQQGNDLKFSVLDTNTGKTEELLCKPR
jgi:uncharacterized protein